MKKIYLLFICLFLSAASFATHIVGGEITVQHVNGNTFNIQLRFYKDCAPGSAAFDFQVKLGIYDKVTNVLVDSITMTRTSTLNVSLGDSCYAPNLCVQEGLYSANKIIPNNVNGYYISWQRCCRNSVINNIVNPLDAGLSFYAEIPNPALGNSNPLFGSYAKTYMCIGQSNTLNLSATDANNDQLVYSIVAPLNSNAAPLPTPTIWLNGPGPYSDVVWNPPYNINNIIGTTPNININSATGIINITPTTLGTFVFTVRVEEYRLGVKIGEIRRDIQYQVINCTNPLIPGPGDTISCSNPTATISVGSSTPITSYVWSGTGITSGGNTSSPTVNADGTYFVTATTNTGCTYTASVLVSTIVSFPNVTPGSSIALSCQSPNGTINASSTTPGAIYSWAGPSIISGGNTQTPTVGSAGTYTVTITDPSNGCTSTATVTVSGSSDLPNVSTNSTLTLNCTTTSGTINASSSTPGVTYAWGGPGIVSGGNTATPTINAGGSYTVTVTNPSNGCTSVGTISITQNTTPPNVSVPSASTITCTSSISSINVSSTTPGATYVWSGSGIISGNNTAAPTANATGTYTVVVTDPGNGCTNTATVTVIDNLINPNVTAGTSLTLTCTSTNGSINASSNTPNVTYSWAGPGIVSNGNTSTPTVNAPGTYTVIVTDQINGCTSTTTVTAINDTLSPDVTSGTPLTLTCVVGSGTISASSTTPNASFAWVGPNFVSGQTTSSPTVNAQGTYTVVVTNPINGCTNSTTVLVNTDNSIPNLSASGALTLTCYSVTDTLFANSSTPNASYLWNGPGIVSGGNSSSPIVSTAGTYTVVVTDPNTGCTNLTTVNVINNIINPNATAGLPTTLTCTITNDTINASSSTSGVNYNWSGPGIVSGGNSSNPIVNTPGTYTVVVTNPINGCTSTATVNVGIDTITPNLTTGATATITCTSSNVQITANSTTSGVIYNWNGSGILSGGGTNSPIINAPGTYTITATNPLNGCTKSDTVSVFINIALPDVSAGANLVLTCNITSSTIGATSSISGANYFWSGPGIVSGVNTSSPIVNAPGTYTVTVTNPLNGCTSSTTVMVTTAPPPIASVSAGVTIALGTSTSLLATGGGTYSWSPSTNLSCTNCPNPVASPTVTTVYCVTVTDQYGCSDSACVEVKVFDPCPPTVTQFPMPNIFSPNYDDKNDVFFIKDWNNECIQEFNIEIYNRWGLKMFESIGANVHWDGRTQSGLESPAGTYYYIVTIKKVRVNEPLIFKGFLTLVR